MDEIPAFIFCKGLLEYTDYYRLLNFLFTSIRLHLFTSV